MRGLGLVALVLAGPALAGGTPAEDPPAGHAGLSFSDSRGCLFARVEHGAALWWAPVLDAAGAPLCQRPAAAAPQAAVVHRHVQVGVFAEAGNAREAIARIQALGLPAASGRSRAGHTIIAAGPFPSRAELAGALRQLRAAGFRDAYSRP